MMNNRYIGILLGIILSFTILLCIRDTELCQEYISRMHNHTGFFYLQDKRFEKAILEFKKALKNPNYSHIEFAYYNLGNAYFTKGDHEKALQAYKQVLVYKPSFEEAKKQINFIEQILEKNNK